MFIELTKDDGNKEILNQQYILCASAEEGKLKVYFTPEHGRRFEIYKETYAKFKDLLDSDSTPSGNTML